MQKVSYQVYTGERPNNTLIKLPFTVINEKLVSLEVFLSTQQLISRITIYTNAEKVDYFYKEDGIDSMIDQHTTKGIAKFTSKEGTTETFKLVLYLCPKEKNILLKDIVIEKKVQYQPTQPVPPKVPPTFPCPYSSYLFEGSNSGANINRASEEDAILENDFTFDIQTKSKPYVEENKVQIQILKVENAKPFRKCNSPVCFLLEDKNFYVQANSEISNRNVTTLILSMGGTIELQPENAEYIIVWCNMHQNYDASKIYVHIQWLIDMRDSLCYTCPDDYIC